MFPLIAPLKASMPDLSMICAFRRSIVSGHTDHSLPGGRAWRNLLGHLLRFLHCRRINQPFYFGLSSQVKLLLTNNVFCIVQRATARSKAGTFRDCGVAEAPPGFQAGWSDCMHFFSLFLFILFAHLEIMQPRHSSPWDDQTTNILRDQIYIHFSTLRFHPVSIISTPLRAKKYISTSRLWQASQKNQMVDLDALNCLLLFK
jgi:hypothetical protein